MPGTSLRRRTPGNRRSTLRAAASHREMPALPASRTDAAVPSRQGRRRSRTQSRKSRGGQLLARANGDLQAILARRDRTDVFDIEHAERVIRAIEIEIVDSGRGPVEVQIPPALIRLGAIRQVAERDEQAAHVVL